jgi:hypothetical protein
VFWYDTNLYLIGQYCLIYKAAAGMGAGSASGLKENRKEPGLAGRT